MCKTLLPLNLVVDADDWKFGGKKNFIFFATSPLFKKCSHAIGCSVFDFESCIERALVSWRLIGKSL